MLGTSLSVQPFASLLHHVPDDCPRVLINLESVGEASRLPPSKFGSPDGFDFDGRTGRAGGIRDVRVLGTTDEGVRRLCKALGWEEELEAVMRKGWEELDAQNAEREEEVEPAEVEGDEDKEAEAEGAEAEAVEDGVDELAAQVGSVKLEEVASVAAEPAAKADSETGPSSA